ncbi:hypothetical protein V8G54_005993 [Vigna mungo]|uniref:Uncharacterized protein n=1 Tax=Vigna mungo TaxID=3915 RepID=A0AAQ3NY66_VIGMU
MAGSYTNIDVRRRFGNTRLPNQTWGIYTSGPYLIFHGQPLGFTVSNNSGLRSSSGHVDFGQYFLGPRLEGLIEQHITNDRLSPPPASHFSIDVMPTIKITNKHLQSDSHCAVCNVCEKHVKVNLLGSFQQLQQLRTLTVHHLPHVFSSRATFFSFVHVLGWCS